MFELIQNMDWSILHAIQNTLSCGFLDFIMPKITLLGNVGFIWILAAIGMICSGKYRKYGFILLGALLVGVLIGNLWLKPFIARPRPCWQETIPLLISNPSDFSFPSGHTLASVIGAFILTAANRKFGIVAIPLAVLIAFSRLYLYVHFPSDIIGGMILGIVIGLGALLLGNKIASQAKIRQGKQ